MFIWFYLGHEPRYVTTMNPKTKQKTRKLVPRDQYAEPPPGADPKRHAESADAQMKRLKERHAQNRGLRESKRRAMAAERMRARSGAEAWLVFGASGRRGRGRGRIRPE